MDAGGGTRQAASSSLQAESHVVVWVAKSVLKLVLFVFRMEGRMQKVSFVVQ